MHSLSAPGLSRFCPRYCHRSHCCLVWRLEGRWAQPSKCYWCSHSSVGLVWTELGGLRVGLVPNWRVGKRSWEGLAGRLSEASSKGIKACFRGGQGGGHFLKPTLLAVVSLSCPAFPLQPSLPAPLLSLGILECSPVSSLSRWIII